jgi:hypothetical protein
MSGWIKIDKTLDTDPRVMRMARALARRFSMYAEGIDLDPCNAVALPGVTLVSGALVRLWIYADSHIREDDTLDLGAVEIDEMLGVPGFCSAMPADWLQVIDDHTVELPGFQEHNGVEAIRKAQTQKRVARHREGKKRDSVTGSNASALPDQTRPDQDQTKTRVLRTQEREHAVSRETGQPEGGSAERAGTSAKAAQAATGTERGKGSEGGTHRAHARDPDEFDADWLEATYPPTLHGRNSSAAIHRAMGLVGMGKATWTDLRRRMLAFASFATAGGFTDSRHVPAMQAWFDANREEAYWSREWTVEKFKPEVTPFRRKTADELDAEEAARAAR